MNTEVSSLLSSVWAKTTPFKSLIHHMIDVGCCAEVLLKEGPARSFLKSLSSQTSLDTDDVCRLLCYLAALHDIGKCHPQFQVKGSDMPQTNALKERGLLSLGETGYHFRHELYTEQTLQRIWQNHGLFSDEIIETFGRVLALHHQGKSGEARDIAARACQWEKIQDQLEREIFNIFQAPVPDDTCFWTSDAFAMGLVGLIVLADWIASGESFCCDEELELMAYVQSARQTAQQNVRECGLLLDRIMPDFKDFTTMWPMIRRDTMRPLQRACEEIDYSQLQLILLEAPMGEGKREAALFAANQIMDKCEKDGFYIALPTSATSNQMHSRMNALFQEHHLGSTRLLHSMAWLIDEKSQIKGEPAEESDSVAKWLRPLRRGLLSQFAVGTVDQAMMAALQVKYGALRLLGLSDKVLIIDEIHAYDAYMNSIIIRLLQWCKAMSIPVILLSATLSSEKKQELLSASGAAPEALAADYPLITTVTREGTVTQTRVGSFMQRDYHFDLCPLMDDPAAAADKAAELVQNGGCLCFLVNTVNRAQELYRLLKDRITADTELLIFHARYTAERRQQIEDECVSKFGKDAGPQRPQKAILICTQVVEQSLDVDFDMMMTELAPVDLLLQRAGRVFRHETTPRPAGVVKPQIFVLTSPKQNYKRLEKIYFTLLLTRTETFLKHTPLIRVPDGMREAIRAVYNNEILQTELRSYSERMIAQDLQVSQAESKELPEPEDDYFFALDAAPCSLFSHADADGLVYDPAKTRLNSDSRRAALVSSDLYQQIKDASDDYDLARLIMMQTVNLRLDESSCLDDDGDNTQSFEGDGLLKGILILCLDKDGSAAYKNNIIQSDDAVGISVVRKQKRE